jgi:6-phosphogluconate dehydrogenase
MKLAMVGLGRMGMGITERLIQNGHSVVGYDLSPAVVQTAVDKGAIPALTLQEVIERLDESPRIVWIMVPAGDPVGAILDVITPLLSAGDIVIEGGNSHYKDSIKRATELAAKGVHLLDTGVSGGVWGLVNGFNLMIGGDPKAFAVVEPIYKALSAEGGYLHVGPSGSGHFTKMIHNGIEYGMMQAYAEGFDLMRAKKDFNIDLGQVARLWQNGSVVRSWLLELAGNALEVDPDLDMVSPMVQDSGEGRWTVVEAIDLSVPIPVISLSLQTRFRTRQQDMFGNRLLSALRNQFGGHPVKKEGEKQ